jgi:hypothetical protein
MKSPIALGLVVCLTTAHVPLYAGDTASGPIARAVAAHAERLAAEPMEQAPRQAAGDASRLELRWDELQPLIRGQRVTVTLTDGNDVRGEVVAVRDDAMVLDLDRRSRAEGASAGGTLARPSVSLIRLERSTGTGGRTLGTIIGVLTGVVVGGYVTGSVADSAGTGIPLFLGLASGITLAGYYTGRRLDRRFALIRVIP